MAYSRRLMKKIGQDDMDRLATGSYSLPSIDGKGHDK